MGGGGGLINRPENITRKVETTRSRRLLKYRLSNVERPQINYINNQQPIFRKRRKQLTYGQVRVNQETQCHTKQHHCITKRTLVCELTESYTERFSLAH